MLAKPVVAGNWKMHKGPAAAAEFVRRFLAAYPAGSDGTVVLFPSAIAFSAALHALGEARPDVRLGVQNVHWEADGAFTGELSAPMAAEAGARLALVGHSERRQLFHETDEDTARKVRAVLDAGLLPVLCVGETLEEREAGEAREVVSRQLDAVYTTLSPQDAARVLVAYEPVWAIGTGRTAAPADAAEMHGHIRARLAERLGAPAASGVPILYGGSVKPGNAAELLASPEVDGLLVGGASLDPDGFARVAGAPG